MLNVSRFLAVVAGLALTVCTNTSSRLEYRCVDSRELGKQMDYAVLAPPPGSMDDEPLPVFYFLHGFGDDHRSLDRFGVSDRLWTAMLEGRLPRAYVFAPNGQRSFYINWYDGTHNYEDYFINEILGAAENANKLTVDRDRRHLLGISMGGLGAVQIGLRHPELFASMASLSGLFPDVQEAKELVRSSPLRRFVDLERIFGNGTDRSFVNTHNPYQIVRNRGPDLGQKLFLAAGKTDGEAFARTNREFHEVLSEVGVLHEYLVYEGGHRWRDWGPIIERAMQYVTH